MRGSRFWTGLFIPKQLFGADLRSGEKEKGRTFVRLPLRLSASFRLESEAEDPFLVFRCPLRS